MRIALASDAWTPQVNGVVRTLKGTRREQHLHLWRRGVDLGCFHPREAPALPAGLARPILDCVGRLAVNKNLEAVLGLPLPGTKLVIGEGPRRAALAARYPQARFLGYRMGDELAQLLSGADVLVFPSLTDTFGLVMIEALACGVPVAAFPVPGPQDVIEPGVTGVLHADLAVAISGALRLDRRECAARARAFSWRAASAQFLDGLVPIPLTRRAAVAVGRSSAMIERIAARRQPSQAGEAN
jgi:glycosyltransferase involved in cell wall biosynthesis